MGDPYGLPEDFRRLISSRTTTHLPPPPDPLSLHHHHHALTLPPPNYDPINFVGGEDAAVFFPPPARAPNPFPHYYNNPSSNSPNLTTTITAATTDTSSDHAFYSTNIDTADKGWFGFDTGTNRWPRQETLSLLDIRSRLDSKFRENNHKAPLWNQISRIMAEEFGYQRSGKKCKEKFENLYKYYKKTKEGKASRQDGKHYRFFRQLEAICGAAGGEPSNTTHHQSATNTVQTPSSFKINHHKDHTNLVDHHHDLHLKSSESHLSFSNSSELETSSSDNNNNNNDEDLSAIAYMLNNSHKKHSSSSSSRDNSNNKQKGLLFELDDNTNNDNHHHQKKPTRRRSLRAKVEELVDSHMRKIIETQDAWMERMLSVVEQREQEMASKEEERKKKDSMRFNQEVHELWAKERAWVEARDAALIEVVRKHIGNNKSIEAMLIGSNKDKIGGNNDEYHNSGSGGGWSEMEISNLIQLRTGLEQRLMRENNSNNGCFLLENGVWEEIAGKLGCMGYERSAGDCKQIWDEISMSLGRKVMDECGAKITRPWCLGLKLTDDDDPLTIHSS